MFVRMGGSRGDTALVLRDSEPLSKQPWRTLGIWGGSGSGSDHQSLALPSRIRVLFLAGPRPTRVLPTRLLALS